MIDIHSHILPGIDDGSKSWDMTLAMCRLAVQDGITHIVTTPHADDTYAYSRDRVREVLNELSCGTPDIRHQRVTRLLHTSQKLYAEQGRRLDGMQVG